MANIKITISAENAQAIASMKQTADVAEKTGEDIEKAGEGSGEGFVEAFKEILSYSKQAIAAIKDIAEAATQTAADIRSTGTAVQEGFSAVANECKQTVAALQEISTAASQVAGNVSQAGQTGADGLEAIEQAAAAAESDIQDVGDAAQEAGADVKNAGQKGADGLEDAADAAAEVEQNTKEAGDAAKKAGNDIDAGAKKGKKGLDGTATAADEVSKKAKGAGNAGAKAGADISAGGKKGADGLNQATKSAESLGQKLANITITAGGISLLLGEIKDAFTALIKPGIDFDKQIEISRIGIAGVLMSMTKLNNEALKLPDALAISNNAIEELTQASGQIGLPLNELTETFQAVVGAGLTQKMTMQEIVDFTITGTKAVKTMMVGVSNEGMQVVQELRSMISGVIDQNSQVARSLGITNAAIEKAKQAPGGLAAYLKEQLSGFAEIIKIYPDTLKGKIDRLTTAFQQVSAKGSEPFTELLKEGLDIITDQLLVTETIVTETGQTLKTVKLNPELIASLKEGSKYLADLVRDGVDFGITLSRVAAGPAEMLLAILKFILDHATQVTFTFMAWLGIQKAISIFRSIQMQIIAVRAAALAAGSAITGMEAATILLGRAIKSVLITTGWGILAVAIGAAAEKMYSLYENTEKAREAKKGLWGEADRSLGSLSAKYESNGDAGIIANNSGDAGGKSYGAWQLSYNMGSLQKFVEWLNDNGWDAGKFLTKGENPAAGIPGHDVVIGSDEFDSLWKEAANKYGESFLNAQKQYIKEAFYDVGVEQAKSVYVDLEKRSEALKNVIWSAAVQHGPENIADLLQQAAGLMKQPNASYLTDEQLIKAIYAVRSSDEWTNGSPELRPQLRGRFNEEMNDALLRLQKESPISVNGGQGDLELKYPKDDAEALAKAKISLAEAISNQTLQAYINDLQSQQTSLDQRKQATEGGFASAEYPSIGGAEYTRQKALITRQIAEAEIAKLEEERQHLEDLAKNNNLSGDEDPINMQTQITQKGTEIAAARNKLAQALEQLGFEDAKAQKELMDKVSDMEIQLMEAQGKTAAANRLRNEKEKQSLVAKLQAEGQPGAVDSVNKLYDIKQAQADFEQAQKDLELANGQLVETQETLMNDLATGVKSAEAVTAEYVTQYHAKTDQIVADLKRIIADADSRGDIGLSNSARALLRQIVKSVNDFADAVIQRIDAELQNEISMINANHKLTSRQKQDLIDEANRTTAVKKATEYEKKANNLEEFDKKNDTNNADTITSLRKDAALYRELSKLPTILEKVHDASKQAFEDGLLDFLERGILECKNLGEAFRNLAVTVLQSIQKVYSEALTKNIMTALGLGSYGGGSKDPWALSNGTKLNSSFGIKIPGLAAGGSIDSGKVSGPGTETSDSILAWADKAQKFIRIANGEFVLRGAAVRKYGMAFLERLNSGVVPTGMLQRYAVGGSLLGQNVSGDIPGPQELTAELTNSNNTTIPLSIMNILDPSMLGKFMRTREGKKALLNYIKDDAGTIRRVLNIPG